MEQCIFSQRSYSLKKSGFWKYIKKADFILLAAFVLVGVLMIVIPLAGSAKEESSAEESSSSLGPMVVIYTAGNEYGRYPLNEDRTVTVSQIGDTITDTKTNVVEIKDGKVCMEESSCRNQICVDTGWISRKNEIIVCLPNQVYVTIEDDSASSGDTGMDAVAR